MSQDCCIFTLIAKTWNLIEWACKFFSDFIISFFILKLSLLFIIWEILISFTAKLSLFVFQKNLVTFLKQKKKTISYPLPLWKSLKLLLDVLWLKNTKLWNFYCISRKFRPIKLITLIYRKGSDLCLKFI